MSFIINHDQVRKELQEFNYVPEPEIEMSIEDEFVCNLEDEELRNIYSLAVLWKEVAVEMLESIDDKRISSVISAVSYSTILTNIFYHLLKEHFSLWEEVADVRKGWKVVVLREAIFVVELVDE